jgi:hypothetical protein
VIDHDQFIDILHLAGTPFREGDLDLLTMVIPARLGLGPMGDDQCL